MERNNKSFFLLVQEAMLNGTKPQFKFRKYFTMHNVHDSNEHTYLDVFCQTYKKSLKN